VEVEILKVVILAGGFGTRISEESHLRPKPMIEIGGAPILWHIMKFYSHYGFNEFVICCGYKGYVIKEYFADYYLHRSDITFDFVNGNNMIVHNNIAEPWKVTLVDTGLNTMSGGRIRRIRKYVGEEPFFLTYGDGVGNIDLNALLDYHKAEGRTVTISAILTSGRFGVIDFDAEGTVKGFREKAAQDGSWINAGFMVAQPGIFNYLTDDTCTLEAEPFDNLSKNGELAAYKHNGYWQCMDTQRDRLTLENCWQSGNAQWKIWE
jgi:glucose-1-phosphate cytidylyltransferase